MSDQISILRRAQRALGNLQKNDYERVKDIIRKLSADPRPSGCLKLAGRDGWRIRVGNYRVIDEINDSEEIVTILSIGHRKDIYREP
ncbi:MAG: type II toxin-antitoxin system RelE/ParE family toxin [Thermosynechococcaceae cyanobacterium]